jgi:hypothetical protein
MTVYNGSGTLGSLRPDRGSNGTGYKLRSGEGPDPKSPWCCECVVLNCVCGIVVFVPFGLVFAPRSVEGPCFSFYSLRREGAER